MTLCPVSPVTLAPQERKERLEIMAAKVHLVHQVFRASLDLMGKKEKEDRLRFPDHLDGKELQAQ